MSKILFLDVDGVVNCVTTSQRHRGFIGIDPIMAFLVGKIQLDTGCEVVLSSDWRHSKDARDEVRKQVVDFIDVTPSIPGAIRGREVKAWLKDHPEVTKHAILDDNSDFDPDQPLFKTSWSVGLTDKIAKAVTNHLNDPNIDNCPACGVSWIGEPIKNPEFFGGASYFHREIGVEILGEYDGIDHWLCPDCGAKFDRGYKAI